MATSIILSGNDFRRPDGRVANHTSATLPPVPASIQPTRMNRPSRTIGETCCAATGVSSAFTAGRVQTGLSGF
jgi:hypothetical protein